MSFSNLLLIVGFPKVVYTKMDHSNKVNFGQDLSVFQYLIQ
jgi:hypothetical protein